MLAAVEAKRGRVGRCPRSMLQMSHDSQHDVNERLTKTNESKEFQDACDGTWNALRKELCEPRRGGGRTTTRTWRCRRKRMNVTLQFDRCGRNAWSRESSVKSCLRTRRRQRSRQRALYSTSCVFCVRSERHCCCSLLTLISCSVKTVSDCVSGPSNCRSDPFASSSLGDRQACHHTCELQFFLVNGV